MVINKTLNLESRLRIVMCKDPSELNILGKNEVSSASSTSSFRMTERQNNKNSQLAENTNSNANADNYRASSGYKGGVDDIDKKLVGGPGNEANPRARFLRQPQNLPAPPVFRNMTNDVNNPDTVSRQRANMLPMNPFAPPNFGFYTTSGAGSYPQNANQANFGFYGNGKPAGAAPPPKYPGGASEPVLSRAAIPNKAMPDIAGADR